MKAFCGHRIRLLISTIDGYRLVLKRERELTFQEGSFTRNILVIHNTQGTSIISSKFQFILDYQTILSSSTVLFNTALMTAPKSLYQEHHFPSATT